jgi:hypothetical protein
VLTNIEAVSADAALAHNQSHTAARQCLPVVSSRGQNATLTVELGSKRMGVEVLGGRQRFGEDLQIVAS